MIADGFNAVEERSRFRISHEMEAIGNEFTDLFLIHQNAEALYINIFFIDFKSGNRFFIDFFGYLRTNSRQVDAEFFLHGRKSVIKNPTVFPLNFDEVITVNQAVFIRKGRIFRIRKDHNLIRVEAAQCFIKLIVVKHASRRSFNQTVAGNTNLN